MAAAAADVGKPYHPAAPASTLVPDHAAENANAGIEVVEAAAVQSSAAASPLRLRRRRRRGCQQHSARSIPNDDLASLQLHQDDSLDLIAQEEGEMKMVLRSSRHC